MVEQYYLLLGSREKEHLLELTRKLEGFYGLTVVSFAFLSNHIHLLIEQPDWDSLPKLTRELLFERLPFIYDSFAVKVIQNVFERADAARDGQWQQRILDRYVKTGEPLRHLRADRVDRPFHRDRALPLHDLHAAVDGDGEGAGLKAIESTRCSAILSL